MSEPRDLRLAPQQVALKVASRKAIRTYGGSDAAAALLGRRQQHYSDCGLPNTPQFLTIDEAVTLEQHNVGAVGHPMILRAMADQLDYEVAPRPRAIPAGANLHELMGAIVRESSDVVNKLCGALASDGRVDDAEAAEIESEIDQLLAVALRMRAVMRAIKAEAV